MKVACAVCFRESESTDGWTPRPDGSLVCPSCVNPDSFARARTEAAAIEEARLKHESVPRTPEEARARLEASRILRAKGVIS
jgi:hypothetical protein